MLLAALLLAAHCAKTHDITACKSDRHDGSYTLRIERGGKTLYEGKEDSTYGTDTIEVHQLDLDADGKAEIVAADFVTMSNGMGVQTWNLVILDGRSGKAATIKVEDYGKGSFQREKDGSYTILETSWDWMGPALYFVARPYEYEHGQLVPQKQQGMWRRRFLVSFQRERGEGGGPGQWLKKAERVKWVSRDALQ